MQLKAWFLRFCSTDNRQNKMWYFTPKLFMLYPFFQVHFSFKSSFLLLLKSWVLIKKGKDEKNKLCRRKLNSLVNKKKIMIMFLFICILIIIIGLLSMYENDVTVSLMFILLQPGKDAYWQGRPCFPGDFSSGFVFTFFKELADVFCTMHTVHLYFTF